MVVHEQSEGMRDASAKQADRAEPPRRRRLWAAAAVTVLVLGGLAAGALLAMDDDGGGADGDGAVSLSAEGTVACASSIAEGRVSQVAPEGDGDRVRVALDVDRSYKPAGGSETRLSFTTSEPDAETYYKVGVRMLVLVSSQEGRPRPPIGRGIQRRVKRTARRPKRTTGWIGDAHGWRKHFPVRRG